MIQEGGDTSAANAMPVPGPKVLALLIGEPWSLNEVRARMVWIAATQAAQLEAVQKEAKAAKEATEAAEKAAKEKAKAVEKAKEATEAAEKAAKEQAKEAKRAAESALAEVMQEKEMAISEAKGKLTEVEEKLTDADRHLQRLSLLAKSKGADLSAVEARALTACSCLLLTTFPSPLIASLTSTYYLGADPSVVELGKTPDEFYCAITQVSSSKV